MKYKKLLFFLFIVCFPILFANAQSALQWKVFTRGDKVFLCSPTTIQLYTATSKTVRPLVIDLSRSVSSYNDVIVYEEYLYVSSDAGLYQIEMNTLSSERISFPEDKIINGKITADMDYIWLASSDTLYRFDKLGSEWQGYALPQKEDALTGIYSSGEELYCLGKLNLYRFTIATEKWNVTKAEKEFENTAVFYPGNNTFTVIEKSSINQYRTASFSWEHAQTPQFVQDFYDEDSVLYFSSGLNVTKLNYSTGVSRPLDIPSLNQIYAIAKLSDTLVIAASNRIVKYNVKTLAMDFVEYPSELLVSEMEKLTIQSNSLIAVYRSAIACYDKENRIWQIIPRSGLKQDVKKITWNADGFTSRYAPGYQSVLKGSIEENLIFKYKGYGYDTTYHIGSVNGKVTRDTLIDSQRVFGYTIPKLPLINLNYKTTFSDDRGLEIYFNNTSLSSLPSKGISYRGNRNDRLNSIKLGTISSDPLSSPTLPATPLEGGAVTVESKERLEGRDRKMLRFSAGSGYMTTRTEWKTLPYRSDGTYYLIDNKKNSDSIETDELGQTDSTGVQDTIRIVPGSVKVWVDGEALDSLKYTFYSATYKLQFTPDAPVDPVSAITIQYKVQTVPDSGISAVEFIPEHKFGLLHFGAVTFSPKEWISARVGFAGICHDSLFPNLKLRKPTPIVNLSTPIELRKESPNLLLKFNPEFSYNMETGARAGAASLQSRIGDKTGFVFNGMFADTNYSTTDTISYGYGAIKNQYDFTLSHDITSDIPVSYYQHRRSATDGTESRYAARAGVHHSGFPFFDVTVSRTSLDHTHDNDTTRIAFDSLFDTKDKVQMNLYETSSKLLENLTHIRKIGYSITHAEYRTRTAGDSWIHGRMSTAELNVTPIQPVSILGTLLYRGGIQIDSMPSSVIRPGIEVQTIDAPKGVDINASYNVKFGRYFAGDSSTDSISRSINIILKPGTWLNALRWFSPRLWVTNDVSCSFGVAKPQIFDLISGLKSKNSSSMLEGFGVNIFPNDAILIRNTNEFSQIDTSEFFKTTNDVQVWLGKSNYIQGMYNYTTLNKYHSGSLTYDRVWTPWIRTTPGITADYKTDSLGTHVNAGPKLNVIFNFDRFWFVKSLSNSHDFKMAWTRLNGITNYIPQIAYTFNITLTILPNIQLSNYETLTFDEKMLTDFQSRTSLLVNF